MLGGSAGAALRWALGGLNHGQALPVGTLAANLVGCFTAGLIMSLVRHSYFKHKSLDNAEAEMTESAVYDLCDYDNPLYLEEHNRIPGAPNEFWSMREAGEYAHIPYDEEYNVKSRS